jgi:ankyrin repeat protein
MSLLTIKNKGRRSAAQALITSGAQLDRVDRVGRNLLHLAAISGDAATISLLLARGIDQHQTDSANMRPLERAIR